jgi:hypothetical protein
MLVSRRDHVHWEVVRWLAIFLLAAALAVVLLGRMAGG